MHCAFVWLIIPDTFKPKTKNYFKNSSCLLSSRLSLCGQMQCGSGTTNFSQQTADAGVAQQHPKDSARTQPCLAQPHQHTPRKHSYAASVTCLQDDRPLLVHQTPFIPFMVSCICLFSKKNNRTVLKLQQDVKNIDSHLLNCTFS